MRNRTDARNSVHRSAVVAMVKLRVCTHGSAMRRSVSLIMRFGNAIMMTMSLRQVRLRYYLGDKKSGLRLEEAGHLMDDEGRLDARQRLADDLGARCVKPTADALRTKTESKVTLCEPKEG